MTYVAYPIVFRNGEVGSLTIPVRRYTAEEIHMLERAIDQHLDTLRDIQLPTPKAPHE